VVHRPQSEILAARCVAPSWAKAVADVAMVRQPPAAFRSFWLTAVSRVTRKHQPPTTANVAFKGASLRGFEVSSHKPRATGYKLPFHTPHATGYELCSPFASAHSSAILGHGGIRIRAQ